MFGLTGAEKGSNVTMGMMCGMGAMQVIGSPGISIGAPETNGYCTRGGVRGSN